MTWAEEQIIRMVGLRPEGADEQVRQLATVALRARPHAVLAPAPAGLIPGAQMPLSVSGDRTMATQMYDVYCEETGDELLTADYHAANREFNRLIDAHPTAAVDWDRLDDYKSRDDYGRRFRVNRCEP